MPFPNPLIGTCTAFCSSKAQTSTACGMQYSESTHFKSISCQCHQVLLCSWFCVLSLLDYLNPDFIPIPFSPLQPQVSQLWQSLFMRQLFPSCDHFSCPLTPRPPSPACRALHTHLGWAHWSLIQQQSNTQSCSLYSSQGRWTGLAFSACCYCSH